MLVERPRRGAACVWARGRGRPVRADDAEAGERREAEDAELLAGFHPLAEDEAPEAGGPVDFASSGWKGPGFTAQDRHTYATSSTTAYHISPNRNTRKLFYTFLNRPSLASFSPDNNRTIQCTEIHEGRKRGRTAVASGRVCIGLLLHLRFFSRRFQGLGFSA